MAIGTSSPAITGAPISYGAGDPGVDATIKRNRQLAQMLQQQAMQPIEQQSAGGWVIPTSRAQGLAKVLQAFAGRYTQGVADARQRARDLKNPNAQAAPGPGGGPASPGVAQPPAPLPALQTPAGPAGTDATAPATGAPPAPGAEPGASDLLPGTTPTPDGTQLAFGSPPVPPQNIDFPTPAAIDQELVSRGIA